MVADVIMNLARQKKYEAKLKLMPEDYRAFVEPISAM